MTRFSLASIAVVGAFAVVPCVVEAQEPTPKKGAVPKSNQVYVKIIVPVDPATRAKDPPVVESWVAEELKKRGQARFSAVTAWVPLVVTGEKFEFPTSVWSGGLDGKAWACPVSGEIAERANGRIKIHLGGWAPIPDRGVTVSLTDEPGSRAIAANKKIKSEEGMPYVAVLIGPPPEKADTPTDQKK